MDKILLSLSQIRPLIGNAGTTGGESGTVLRHLAASGGIWNKKELNFQKEVEFFFGPDYEECSLMFRNREHNREQSGAQSGAPGTPGTLSVASGTLSAQIVSNGGKTGGVGVPKVQFWTLFLLKTENVPPLTLNNNSLSCVHDILSYMA